MTEKIIRQQPILGVIGGTHGIDALLKLMTAKRTIPRPGTPYGSASDVLYVGELAGLKTVALKQHGQFHQFNPTHIPYRANIYGFKKLGVTHLVLISAFGSLREEIIPGKTLFIPDQFIDRTRHRDYTLFDEIAVHVEMGDPVCQHLARDLLTACLDVVHNDAVVFGGTLLVMEGPSFSTRAQSRMYRQVGADGVGMTAIPTAMLAREAIMCFAVLGLAADRDAYQSSQKAVSQDEVADNLARYGNQPIQVIQRLADQLARKTTPRQCYCADALKHAVLTDLSGASIPLLRRPAYQAFGIDLPTEFAELES